MWKSKSVHTIAGILVVSFGCVFLSAGDGMGQPFPNRPVTIIVAFTAGGSTDVVTRSIAAVAEKKLGVPLIIVNKPGAGGVIGTELAAKAAPDGYVILMVSAGHTINPAMVKKLPYDSVKDFTPISMIADVPTQRRASRRVRLGTDPRGRCP